MGTLLRNGKVLAYYMQEEDHTEKKNRKVHRDVIKLNHGCDKKKDPTCTKMGGQEKNGRAHICRWEYAGANPGCECRCYNPAMYTDSYLNQRKLANPGKYLGEPRRLAKKH